MLFSYIYHHPKVRAAEGLLEKMLDSAVRQWRTNGEDDHTILKRFLAATDSSLFSALESDNSVVVNYSYRIRNRLLPREVYGLGGADATHADEVLLTRFLTDLQKRSKREEIISEVERLIGEELKHQKSELADLTWQEANTTAGVWFDVPKLPKIEDVDDIVIGRNTGTKIPLTRAFPVGEWTEAYTHFKYQVRVFAFSEYWEATTVAGRKALEKVTGIADTDFYNGTKRQRD
jgi:HD superfamily phosphohydrolase